MSLFPEDGIIHMADGAKSTGKAFEDLLEEHLRQKYPGYDVKTQVNAGIRPKSGKKIRVDFLFNHSIIISAKFQGVPGTAEEKIIQEKGVLQYLCDNSDRYTKAYVVYHGNEFTLIEDYQSEEMKKYYRDPFTDVTLISFDEFKELQIV